MFEAIAVTPTLNFQTAQPLTAGGIAIDLGSHAAPKLVDWNADGVLDLLVAAGDGSIWLFRQSQSTNSTDFEPGARITAEGADIRVGSGGMPRTMSTGALAREPGLIATGFATIYSIRQPQTPRGQSNC